ncbi:MAG: hypothetical protein U5P41_02150 [Gammaproteobacteria bacterium]|nr:hypothetical protein [Gammaproteobacteria bacterium]
MNLNQQPPLPASTKVLVLAGPQVDVFPGEIDIIRAVHRQRRQCCSWLERSRHRSTAWKSSTGDVGHRALQDGAIIDFAGQMLGIDDPDHHAVDARLSTAITPSPQDFDTCDHLSAGPRRDRR